MDRRNRIFMCLCLITTALMLVFMLVFDKGQLIKLYVLRKHECSVPLTNVTSVNFTELPEDNADYDSIGFQPVKDVERTFVYSAYYDPRGDTVLVRVIALVKNPMKFDTFTCVADLQKDCTRVKIYPATLEYIIEPRNWNYTFRSGFIKCRLEASDKPKFISIISSTQTDHLIHNKLLIRYNNKVIRNVTRCVPPFHNFGDSSALIQMLEYDQIFGTDFIQFYDNSKNTLQKVINSYQKEGLVSVLKWNLPTKWKQIHYYGQMLHIHDCLYRNMFLSKYVFFADIDEIVTSEIYPSWSKLVKANPKCDAFVFLNAFFPTFWADTKADFPGKSEAQRLRLKLLLKTNSTKVHGINYRSKPLVKPEVIDHLWIHGVERFHNKNATLCPMKNIKVGLLHHYRAKWTSDMERPYVHITTLHRYSSQFIQNVKARLKKIHGS